MIKINMQYFINVITNAYNNAIFFGMQLLVNSTFLTQDGFWRKKTYNTKYDILCFGGSSTFKNKNNNWITEISKNNTLSIADLSCNVSSNELIVEKIITYCNIHKPKAIFVLFEEIDTFCVYTNHNSYVEKKYTEFIGDSKYDLLQQYRYRYNINTIFFDFIKNIEYISLFCELQNIKFFWYTTSKLLLKIDESFFPENTTITKKIDIKNSNTDFASEVTLLLHEYI